MDCDDSRYGDDLCLLYKKDPEIGCNKNNNANTKNQNINDQDTIEFNNDYLKILHKKMP